MGALRLDLLISQTFYTGMLSTRTQKAVIICDQDLENLADCVTVQQARQ